MRSMRWLFVTFLVLGTVCVPAHVEAAPQDDEKAKAAAMDAAKQAKAGEGQTLEEALAEAAEQEAAKPEDVFYALGLAMAENLIAFDLSAEELDMVKVGLVDSVLGNDKRVELKDMRPEIQALLVERREAAVTNEKAASAEFVQAMAAEDGAVLSDSGMVYKELVAGEGESPAAEDRVKVHYHGTLRDGTVFDSSVDRGEPASFGLRQVIKCWTEGVQMMKVGGKARLACPSDIAYGDRGRPPLIKGGATLVFDVELLEIIQPIDASE